MAHLLANSLLLYIPKTGSDWLRKTCHLSVEGGVKEIGDWHCDLLLATKILAVQNRPLPFTGAFVRHPLEWYRSAWVYWKQTNRFPRRDDDPRVEHENFEQFVHNCMEAEPDGYVTTLYRRFIGDDFDSIPFIGRQESLADDLIRFLRLAGETFDEQKIRQVPRSNVRGSAAASEFPGYNFDLAQFVLRREKQVIQQFY